MYTSRRGKMITVVVLAGVVSMCLWAGTAAAQRGGGPGGPQLAPEKAEAAWTLEAKGVAKSLNVSAENTDKLVKAYIASRKSAQEEIGKITETGRDRFAAMQKINDAEREKLKKALADILPKDQVDKAAAPLGTLSPQWDRLVDTLSGFKLDGDKQDKALGLIAAFVVESTAARAKAMADGGDMQAMRDAMQTLKGKLDEDIAKLLSAEQAATWKEQTTMRRGGGGGGGGRGGDRPAPAPAPSAPTAPAPAK